MDISKLSPAPWMVDPLCIETDSDGDPVRIEIDDAQGNLVLWTNRFSRCAEFPGCGGDKWVVAEFIALARNAFDVMIRRTWTAVQHIDKTWGVQSAWSLNVPTGLGGQGWSDPYTALVEADKWYKENVECRP